MYAPSSHEGNNICIIVLLFFSSIKKENFFIEVGGMICYY